MRPGLVLVAALLAMLLLPTAGHTAVYTVDTTVDGIDSNAGDGTCATAGGQCTLRAAVMEANATPGTGSDTIVFGSALNGEEIRLTIPGEGGPSVGDLTLAGTQRTLVVVGNGWQNTIIRQTIQNRVFAANHPAAHLWLQNLTVKGGRVPSSMSSPDGGGIRANTRLTLDQVLVASNEARLGGGVYVPTDTPSPLTIRNSTIAHNRADEDGGGIYVVGGGDNSIENARIAANESLGTGGASLDTGGPGTTTLDQVAVTDNRSTGSGAGGILALDFGFQRILRSEISGNVGNGAVVSAGLLEVGNTTISGNSGLGFAVTTPNTGSGTITMRHVTLHDNGDGGGGPTSVLSFGDLTPEFEASIITGTCAGLGGAPSAVESFGYNVITDPTCMPGAPPASDTAADPMLAPLNNNGGGTRTHLLSVGSPAIDRVNPCLISPFDVDQRSAPRPAAGSAWCDSGAYERGTGASAPVPSPPIAEKPSNITPPSLSGTPTVGETLTCSSGSWSPTVSLSFAYRWLRGATLIAGATSSSYVVASADQGSQLRCRVTASNPVGSGAPATSSAVSVPPASPGAGSTPSGTSPGTSSPSVPPPSISPPDLSPPGTNVELGEAAKLKVRRAGVVGGRLDVLARITRRADGDRVRVSFRAAGRRTSFTARVREGTVRFARRLSPRQQRAGSGIMEIHYAGNDRVRPDQVRLRAARNRALLRLDGRPVVRSGRIAASGTASRRSRGIVRLRLEYVTPGGQLGTWVARARINRGRWRIRERVPAGAENGYFSAQFTGFVLARGGPMRGEQDAAGVQR